MAALLVLPASIGNNSWRLLESNRSGRNIYRAGDAAVECLHLQALDGIIEFGESCPWFYSCGVPSSFHLSMVQVGSRKKNIGPV